MESDDLQISPDSRLYAELELPSPLVRPNKEQGRRGTPDTCDDLLCILAHCETLPRLPGPGVGWRERERELEKGLTQVMTCQLYHPPETL